MKRNTSEIVLYVLAGFVWPFFLTGETWGGTVVTWGEYNSNLVAPPGVTNVVAIASGEQSMVALLSDGTVVAWGELSGQPRPNQIDSLPVLSNVASVASGDFHALALQKNGRVVAWGSDQFGQTRVPANLSNVSAIACGLYHNLALTSNGTVVAWGDNKYGEASVPPALTNAVAIGAGQFHSLAVVEDGTVVAWGAGSANSGPDWNGRQSIVPVGLSNVVAVTGGQEHSLALKRDGTVVGWGANEVGQTNVPSSLENAVKLACGTAHNVALRSDGTVVMWGYGAFGQTNVPSGLKNVIGVDAMLNFSSAVVGDGSPVITVQPFSRIVATGRTVVFVVLAAGSPQISYQWRVNGTDLPGATASLLTLTNVQFTDAGRYSALLYNTQGTTGTVEAVLRVVDGLPFISAQPRTQTVVLGSNAAFVVAATGTTPISYQWQFKGTNLVNETNAVLTRTNVQPADGGAYRAILSNPLGSVTSVVATLTVFLPVVTVHIEGQGTVTKSPNQPFYNVGDSVTLTTTPGRWFSFTRWADGVTDSPRVITIGTNNNYTAIFSPITPLETLTFNGVSRTAPVGMPAILVDGQFVVTGAVTRLGSAQVEMLTTCPNGAVLYSTDGTPPSLNSLLYIVPFSLHRSTTLRAAAWDANFVSSWEADPIQVVIKPVYSLVASTQGGGNVSLSPTNAPYLSNTLVTITATPDAGWTFLQWLGDASGTSATNTVLMTRNKCVEAMFGTTLSAVVADAGSVIVQPNIPLYPYGTMARLTALPQAGNSFSLWGNAGNGTKNPLLYSVTTSNRTISAAFTALNTAQYALTLLVDGLGTVSNSPHGSRFAANTNITLAALPNAEQQFLSWSGDASGAQNPLTVTLNQSKVITAQFTKHALLSFPPCVDAIGDDQLPVWLRGEWAGKYAIESASNLAGPWATFTTLTNQLGRTQFPTPGATNGLRHFYRAVGD